MNVSTMTPMTTAQAAERLSVDEETVRRYIKSGRLQAGRLGVKFVLHPDDVEDLRKLLARAKLAKLAREAAQRNKEIKGNGTRARF